MITILSLGLSIAYANSTAFDIVFIHCTFPLTIAVIFHALLHVNKYFQPDELGEIWSKLVPNKPVLPFMPAGTYQ